MNPFEAPGLPVSAQVPASVLLVLLLAIGLRVAQSASARFIVFACWLRFMLSSYHVYTFKPVIGSISGTAFGSASLFVLGLVLLPKRMLVSAAAGCVYAVAAAIVLSGALNADLISAFEPMTKFGLFLVVALHAFHALQTDDERRLVSALLTGFAPLLVFQSLSIAMHVPKSTEGSGGESYIGGYYHEAAFSIGLVAMLAVAAVASRVRAPVRWIIFPLGIAGIILANYRTAILATMPLVIYYLLLGIGRLFDPRLRGLVVAFAGAGLIFVSGMLVMNLDRFSDLRSVAAAPGELIKPPDDFTRADQQLLSGRAEIWSQYVYKWKEADGLKRLVGFGPESWEDYFGVYAHNTFIDFLFEYGLIGLGALIFLFLSGVATAWKARRHRWKLVAAHLSFITLNLATMPLWLVEGNLLYGLLWGYTLFYRAQRHVVVVQQPARPALRAVSV